MTIEEYMDEAIKVQRANVTATRDHIYAIDRHISALNDLRMSLARGVTALERFAAAEEAIARVETAAQEPELPVVPRCPSCGELAEARPELPADMFICCNPRCNRVAVPKDRP